MRISFAIIYIFAVVQIDFAFSQDQSRKIPSEEEAIVKSDWKAETIESLREKQFKVAQRWQISATVTTGLSWFDWEEQYPSYFAVRDAELNLAKTSEERLRALQIHADSMNVFVQKIDVLNRTGSKLGEARRLAQAQFYYSDARLAYLDERKDKDKIPHARESLLKERLEAAEKWVQGEASQKELSLPDTSFESILAVTKAKLGIAKTKEERLAALKGDVDRVQVIFDKVHALYKSKSCGGETKVLERAKFHLCDAKIRYAIEEGANSIKPLREEKLQSAKAWLVGVEAQIQSLPNRSEFFAPILAVRTATLDLTKTKIDRLEVMRESIDELQKLHDSIEALFKSNSKGGEGIWMGTVRYHLLSAEIEYKLEAAKK